MQRKEISVIFREWMNNGNLKCIEKCKSKTLGAPHARHEGHECGWEWSVCLSNVRMCQWCVCGIFCLWERENWDPQIIGGEIVCLDWKLRQVDSSGLVPLTLPNICWTCPLTTSTIHPRFNASMVMPDVFPFFKSFSVALISSTLISEKSSDPTLLISSRFLRWWLRLFIQVGFVHHWCDWCWSRITVHGRILFFLNKIWNSKWI